MKSGAIGELNMVEAWLDRNTASRRLAVHDSAGRFAIKHRLGPLSGQRAQAPFEPIRLFRWRNYSDYGTGSAATCSCICLPDFTS